VINTLPFNGNIKKGGISDGAGEGGGQNVRSIGGSSTYSEKAKLKEGLAD